jgi:hypothetical protein
MIPGETIANGASKTCTECQVTLFLKVCQSAAGYYVGTQCNCGPYSRESGYFGSREDAELALKHQAGLRTAVTS